MQRSRSSFVPASQIHTNGLKVKQADRLISLSRYVHDIESKVIRHIDIRTIVNQQFAQFNIAPERRIMKGGELVFLGL